MESGNKVDTNTKVIVLEKKPYFIQQKDLDCRYNRHRRHRQKGW